MICVVRYIYECNSSSNVIRVIKYFLFIIKVYFRGENVYLVWLIYFIIREFEGFDG